MGNRTSPVEFRVPYPRDKSRFCKEYGLNRYWAGVHWSVRKKNADAMHDTVAAVLSSAKIKRETFAKPVKVTFWHDDRLDIDNHAVIEKLIVDSLRGWLLENDDKRFYRKKVSCFHTEDYIRVRIEVCDASC